MPRRPPGRLDGLKAIVSAATGGMVFPTYYNQWTGGQADWSRNVRSPGLWGWLPGATRDYQWEAQQPWLNGIVSIGLDWLIDNFHEPDLVVAAKGPNRRQIDPIEGHEAIDRLDQPNPFDDGATLWAATILSFKVEGNAYWKKVTSAAGKPVEYWWMPHWATRPRWNNEHSYIDWYDYQVAGKILRVPVDEVIHFKHGKDPDNQRIGRSPLKAILRSLVADNEGEGYDVSLMKNLGIAPTVFSPKAEGGQFTKDDAEELKNTWIGEHGGDNRGKPAVLSGAVDVNTVALSPEEMMLPKARAYWAAKILAAMGLNAQAVGLPDDERTYANYETAIRAAYNRGLVPMQTRFAATLSRQSDLIDPARERLVFDYSHVQAMQEDAAAKSDRVISEWTNDVRYQGETRAALGLPVEPEMEKVLFSDLQAKRQQASAEHQYNLDKQAAADGNAPEPGEDDA